MSGREKPTAKVRVRCLPVAGRENPYQYLMMEGLRSDLRLDVRHGADGKFFAALRTCLRDRPDYLHYDWINRYFLRRRAWWTWLNAPLFLLELLIVRYVLGSRIVWTLHNLRTHDAAPSRVEQWVRRRFARLCDWIRVFHPSTVARAAEYLGVGPDKFVVLPEGSYVGFYPNDISPREARARLGLDEDTLVLLYLGGIRPYKGLDELVAAFQSVAAPAWTLLIAGRPLVPSYAEEIAQLSQADARIRTDFRFIPNDELQVYYNASDVVVLPFKHIENSGTAILAMGFARPVMAPALGVLPERLCRQEALLYEPGHLAEVLAELKETTRNELHTVGRRNIEEVQRYCWEDYSRVFEASRAPVVV